MEINGNGIELTEEKRNMIMLIFELEMLKSIYKDNLITKEEYDRIFEKLHKIYSKEESKNTK